MARFGHTRGDEAQVSRSHLRVASRGSWFADLVFEAAAFRKHSLLRANELIE